MEKKKESIISIVAIVVLILAIVGVSFAAFNYSRTGEKVNTITTGVISMAYTETDNVINMDGALPTTDATGMVRLKEGEYFDFSISSTIQGTVNINYEISAKDITVLEGDEQKIDGAAEQNNGHSLAPVVAQTAFGVVFNLFAKRHSREFSFF